MSRADHDETAAQEQAWRERVGAHRAARFRFRDSERHRGCGWRGAPGTHPSYATGRNWCANRATWKVARAPMSVTGVRYYCDEHVPAWYPDAPEERAP